MLKAELGYTLTANVATADDQQLYRLIDNEQKRLAADYDWSFLDKYADVAATVGSRNLNLPLTNIVFERPTLVTRLFNTLWQEIGHGISDAEYNVVNSDLAVQQDPIQRWRLNSDGTTFEVWPIPSTAQTIRFHGQRPITSLQTAGAYDPAKALDLDDLLVVLFVAANRLARTKQADAQLTLARAQARLQMLRVSGPALFARDTILGGDAADESPRRRNVGMTVVVAP